MPESRKRPGHHEHVEPSPIPASQRTKGRVLWAILFGVFSVIAVYFGVPDDPVALVVAALAGALIGYFAGRSMEQSAKKKEA